MDEITCIQLKNKPQNNSFKIHNKFHAALYADINT